MTERNRWQTKRTETITGRAGSAGVPTRSGQAGRFNRRERGRTAARRATGDDEQLGEATAQSGVLGTASMAGTQVGNAAPKRPAGELEAENARLRRELTNAKLDIGILRKAAAYFVRESRESTPRGEPRPVPRGPGVPAAGRLAQWLPAVARASTE